MCMWNHFDANYYLIDQFGEFLLPMKMRSEMSDTHSEKQREKKSKYEPTPKRLNWNIYDFYVMDSLHSFVRLVHLDAVNWITKL